MRIRPVTIRANQPAQRDFLADWTTRHVAYCGGWGAGKSWAGAHKLVWQHVHNAVDFETGILTGCKSLAVGQTYSLVESITIPNLQAALDESGLTWRLIRDMKVYAFEIADFSSFTGRVDDLSLIYLRSADAPESITGFEVGTVWGDEAARWRCDTRDPTRNPLIQIEGRVRHPRARIHQVNYTYTNEGDTTAVYRAFEANAGSPDYRLFRGKTAANRFLPESYVKSLQSTLTTDLASQYLDGVAANLTGGNVYRSFNAAVNVVDSYEPKLDQPLHLACDYNVDPGMHAVIGQWKDAHTLIAFDELFVPKGSVLDLAQAFHRWVLKRGGWAWPSLWVFADATNATSLTRGESTNDVLRQSLQQLGYPVSMRVASSNPLVADRVNAANCAMMSADGRTRYYVHRRCERLIRDYRSLRWDQGQVDKSDHTMSHASDADTYRIFYLMPLRF